MKEGKNSQKNQEEKYNHRLIEPKWEKRWEEADLYRAVDPPIDKPKKYILFEFPYPSGERLHIGHAFAFTGTDILARFYRMKGFNVLCPMGWDAFGLPAENYAIKTGINPMITTAENIANAKAQAKRWGLSVDWTREIATIDPKYYRWTQWIFLQWYKKGLAYKAKMPINWCPRCKIGLANEEVVGNKCERCGTEVSRRNIDQWVVKITTYADRLIEGLEKTAFIEKVKAAQINWIGRSEGAEIKFEIRNSKSATNSNSQNTNDRNFITVFTTRPDTLYGATFMVVAPEHLLVQEILNPKSEIRNKFKIQNSKLKEIERYVGKARKKSDLERTELNKEKTGVFSGLYAINPVTGKEIPVWISDFVLASYGTGAIMAVPAHDERDYAFAKKFGLPIVPVIVPEGEDEDGKWESGREVRVGSENWDFEKGAYTEVEKGITINSPEWNGMLPIEAIKKAIAYLEKKGIGERAVSYHLRDWIFSRQHYWGEPIPIVYCEKCGEVPVPEEELPVELPKVENYKPTETGESPLAAVEEWVKTKCPKCGGPAKRETDTMPNWAGSDWYFLAYCFADKLNKFKARSTKSETNPKSQIQNSKQKSFENYNAKYNLENSDLDIRIFQNIFEESKDILGYWLPVDIYVGGDEHNTLHLLYSRFTYQFLWDIGAVPKKIPEPYYQRVSHGVILGTDGQRMSKSRGNVINPDEIVEGFGADSLRVYLLFMGPFDATLTWSQEGLEGCYRFLRRVWNLVQKTGEGRQKEEDRIIRKLHQTIKKVGDDIESMKFNTAVAAIMELLNEASSSQSAVSREFWEKFLLILAPFAPHITEELWERLGNKFSIHQQPWPKYNPDLITEEMATIAVQINGRLRAVIEVESGKGEDGNEVGRMAQKNEKIKKYLEGKEIKRTIFVPGKLINFVV